MPSEKTTIKDVLYRLGWLTTTEVASETEGVVSPLVNFTHIWQLVGWVGADVTPCCVELFSWSLIISNDFEWLEKDISQMISL